MALVISLQTKFIIITITAFLLSLFVITFFTIFYMSKIINEKFNGIGNTFVITKYSGKFFLQQNE
jgi:hypothetical protein